MKLLIVGLPRSGTTAFWRAFRQDARLTCYDEPFNVRLRELPRDHWKRTRGEFIALFERDPQAFWRLFSPIDSVDVLQTGLSDRQRNYIRYVYDSANDVAADMIKVHFKVDALHQEFPNAFLIHLFRPASHFVSSHLLPSGPGLSGWAYKNLRRRAFWKRTVGYDTWGVEGVIGVDPHSLFGQRLEEQGIDPAVVYRWPAVGRLMAYWWVNFSRAQADSKRLFKQRYMEVNFAKFSADPAQVLSQIYGAFDWPMPRFQLEYIRRSRPAYCSTDERWLRYADLLGVPPGLLH